MGLDDCTAAQMDSNKNNHTNPDRMCRVHKFVVYPQICGGEGLRRPWDGEKPFYA